VACLLFRFVQDEDETVRDSKRFIRACHDSGAFSMCRVGPAGPLLAVHGVREPDARDRRARPRRRRPHRARQGRRRADAAIVNVEIVVEDARLAKVDEARAARLHDDLAGRLVGPPSPERRPLRDR
jgi:hypothetical protein